MSPCAKCGWASKLVALALLPNGDMNVTKLSYPRNWSRVKRGGKLGVRLRGFSEEGRQWEYRSFAGSLDGHGDLFVEYREGLHRDVVFEGKLQAQ